MANVTHRAYSRVLLAGRPAACCARKRSTTATLRSEQVNEPVSLAAANVTRWEDLPGPVNLPYIGTTYKFFAGKDGTTKLHQIQAGLVKNYGKVFRMTLGSDRCVVVADASMMEEIIRNEDPLPLRDAPMPWKEYLKIHNQSGGLLTSQDLEWERKRRAVRSLMLKPFAMEDFIPSLSEITEDLVAYLASKRDASHFIQDMPQHLYRFSFEGIVSVMFGERAGCLGSVVNKRGDDFINAVSEILDACFNRLMITAPLERKLNTKMWQRHEQAWNCGMANTRYFSERMVDKLSRSELDFTPMAMSLVNNPKLNTADVEYMLMEFLFGGVDTTSNTLGFVLHALASHPEKQEKLRQEVLKHSSDGITMSSVQNMKYLSSCIKETLRLYPVLFINGRQMRDDYVTKDGIELKAEDRVMFFHYYINRDSNTWQDADKFMPERFDRSATNSTSAERQLVSIPFGFGTRGCIGKRIAEIELSLCIIKILTRFNLTIHDSVPFEPRTRALLTPGHQIPVRFTEHGH